MTTRQHHCSRSSIGVPSFVRPTAVLTLMSLALLGHAPAWWHVASCGAGDGDATSTSSCCPHCGCNGAGVDPDGGSVPTDADHCGSGSHDHDDCFICQSLAVPIGENAIEPPPTAVLLPAVYLSTVAAVIADPRGPASHFARGPPARV